MQFIRESRFIRNLLSRTNSVYDWLITWCKARHTGLNLWSHIRYQLAGRPRSNAPYAIYTIVCLFVLRPSWRNHTCTSVPYYHVVSTSLSYTELSYLNEILSIHQSVSCKVCPEHCKRNGSRTNYISVIPATRSATSRSHSSQFFSHLLTAPLPLQCFKQQIEKIRPIVIQRIGLYVFINHYCASSQFRK